MCLFKVKKTFSTSQHYFLGKKNLLVKYPWPSQSFIHCIFLSFKGKSHGGGQVFLITLHETTHQTAFINYPGIGNRRGPSEVGRESTSPTSPQSTTFLIVFVILNEISVKTQACLQRQDWGDKISADFQNRDGVARFPVTKAVAQAGHEGNKDPHSLKAESELMCSWPWRKHQVSKDLVWPQSSL